MSFIFITLFVPLVTAFVLLVLPTWPVRNPENRKKFAILVGGGLLLGAIASVSLYYGAVAKVYHKEVWNFKITGMKYEEKWSKKESRTRQVPCGTDSKGNIKYRTETYYVTAYYGPYWNAKDEYGNWYRSNSSEYSKWKAVWKNEKKTGEHRGSATMLKKAITGGIFQCTWTGEFETIFPYSTIHSYKNKVRESNSVFKYKEPTEELLAKYPRPADEGNTCPIFGYGVPVSGNDILLLKRTNASLGATNEIHSIVMLFEGNDSGVVENVLTAWRSPNKNELVTFIGIENGNVVWCDVESWLDNTTIHGTIETALIGKKWNSKIYSDVLRKHVPKQWNRKEFIEFDYLKVSIHIGWVVSALVICLAINTGIFFILEHAVYNDGNYCD